ncbi:MULTISPECIES: MarR family winged helix-turn-helix transcriptional regulator [Brevibacterium]|uniref:MarR family winged helix-turn-helix transcriptional regulator n=1 Tax=Brevibacterium TaxID=1696 RepID=UPI00037C0455|nr:MULTISPECIES: MarR family transcriptional regulator [Brevibacterium]MCG7300309.1 MarR family transcriptional regulator [Brevibacterium ravenspurgense]OFT99081.1 MarR family transcriptional regulator [Brevibacterium sp. HMSC22B09]
MTSTRWLDETQQRFWRAMLQGQSLLQTVLDRELRELAGIALADYEVLVIVSESPGHTRRMAEIAEEVGVSRSRLSHTVARLEKRGILKRTSTRGDGRGVNCSMTDEGWELMQKIAPIHVEGVREHLIDLMSPEETQVLADVFTRAAEHLRKAV